MADANAWPPEPFDIAFARYRELDAWYSGNAEVLAEIYSGSVAATTTHSINGQSYRGGVLGSLSKFFLGQPIVTGEQRMRMHLPLAADLCTLSADLLFGEGMQVVFRKPEDHSEDGAKPKKWVHASQARLDSIIATDEARAELLLAGEYSAALGGSFIAAAWHPDVAEHVFPKAYAADCAIPQFIHGRLSGVRLWTEYRDGNEVWRLVETHKRGEIEYTLHKGTDRTLGRPRPIAERPETAHYEKLRNRSDMDVATERSGMLPESIKIGTGADGFAVSYMPNARPVRDWRKMGQLAHLGRSDLDGIQDELDKVDMVWSSLMRDIENGQGRLVVPQEMLELSSKPGEGAKIDLYRQVFTPVGASLGKAADSSGGMSIVQFAIRVDDHLKTIEALKKEIGSALGYSDAHLGIDNARGLRTATDVNADLSDSERTRDKKGLYAKAAVSRWSIAALQIDRAVFGGDELGDLSSMPDVVFPAVSQADPEKLARTATLERNAQGASTKTIVRTLRPDWDDTDVDNEVALILKEFGRPAPDPTTFDGEDPIED